MADLINQSGGPLLPEQFFDFNGPVESKAMVWEWAVATETESTALKLIARL